MNNNKNNNLNHYDKFYSQIDLEEHLKLNRNFNGELKRIKSRHTAQNLLFCDEFNKEIKNERILEVGCGTCFNALIMSLNGADVSVFDLSNESINWMNAINHSIKLSNPLKWLEMDISNFKSKMIDFKGVFDRIVCIDLIHHLTHDQESEMLNFFNFVLKPGGKITLVEPLENSKVLKFIKNLFPSFEGRPSLLQTKKFFEYRKIDPHPVRNNSLKHYVNVAKKNNYKIKYLTWGIFNYLNKFFPMYKDKIIKLDNKVANIKYFNFIYQRIRIEYQTNFK
jgi:cyclopropane fatty-acyl-phospholipid synthase-like methyltransferase